jgi:hypothetical protein
LVVCHREIEPLLRRYEEGGPLRRVGEAVGPDEVNERLRAVLVSGAEGGTRPPICNSPQPEPEREGAG